MQPLRAPCPSTAAAWRRRQRGGRWAQHTSTAGAWTTHRAPALQLSASARAGARRQHRRPSCALSTHAAGSPERAQPVILARVSGHAERPSRRRPRLERTRRSALDAEATRAHAARPQRAPSSWQLRLHLEHASPPRVSSVSYLLRRANRAVSRGRRRQTDHLEPSVVGDAAAAAARVTHTQRAHRRVSPTSPREMELVRARCAPGRETWHAPREGSCAGPGGGVFRGVAGRRRKVWHGAWCRRPAL